MVGGQRVIYVLCFPEMLRGPPCFFSLPQLADGGPVCPLGRWSREDFVRFWGGGGAGRGPRAPGAGTGVGAGSGGGNLRVPVAPAGSCAAGWSRGGQGGIHAQPGRGCRPAEPTVCGWIVSGLQALLRLCPAFLAFLLLPGPLPACHPGLHLGAPEKSLSAGGWSLALLKALCP